MTFRLIFASQLVLDSLHQLIKISELPYHRLMVQNKIMFKSIQSLTAFSQQFDHKSWSRARRELEPLSEGSTHFVWPEAEPIVQRHTKMDEVGARDYLLLKRSRVLSGW